MSDHAAYSDRLAALEAVVTAPKIGLVDQVEHLRACLEDLRRTVWTAAGTAAGASSMFLFLTQWLLK